MRALTVLVLVAALVGGFIVLRFQHVRADEARREAEHHRAVAEGLVASHEPGEGDLSMDELRQENAELKREVEELRTLIAEVQAAVEAGK